MVLLFHWGRKGGNGELGKTAVGKNQYEGFFHRCQTCTIVTCKVKKTKHVKVKGQRFRNYEAQIKITQI